MSEIPASADLPQDDGSCPAPSWPEWMDDPAYLALWAEDIEECGEDSEDEPPPDVEDGELAAMADQIARDQARLAVTAARLGVAGALAAGTAAGWGRRGPGMPGSAESFPGVYASRSSGFASGKPLDTAPGCLVLAQFAEEAAGPDDRYPGASDDEMLGVVAAWERAEAYVSSRKHAAVAEVIRRRPAEGCTLHGPAQMPETCDEFTARELGAVLGESEYVAGDMLSLAQELEVNLPGTKAAFRAGIVNQRKAMIIASGTVLLEPDQARAAEALVLGRAGSMTPPGLRAAIKRAVMEVAPGKAKKHRDHAAKKARVERWAEGSGNGGLAGRELPPAQVLAADQRVTAWARELEKAGLDGGMDALRARAFLDILLGMDSRPLDTTPGCARDPKAAAQRPAPEPEPGPEPGPFGPLAGMIPPGFAGHVNLTIPAATLTRLIDRPGELGGIGPIDPDLARELASAAARNPRSTWCVTVTDQEGHAVGHGCARLVKPCKTDGHDPPGEASFTLTSTGQPGPPGGHGTWRFTTGYQDLLIQIGPIPTGDCDHRHEARGHDPGIMLRHLAEVRHATCTGPGCRRPAGRCDFEHNIPYEAGGRTCLCNADPKCRFDHRLKQHPRWKAEHLPNGNIRWTTPSGRQYITEPTRYPI
jgi:hypothetical protein